MCPATSWLRTRETKRAGVILIFSLLMACDQQKISELEEGVSSEAAVRKRFGEPAAIYQEPNGDKTLEYPRQPAGHVNYMISIGPDGNMSALRQVLTLANFRRVGLGLDQQQVRHMLGADPPRVNAMRCNKKRYGTGASRTGRRSRSSR